MREREGEEERERERLAVKMFIERKEVNCHQ